MAANQIRQCGRTNTKDSRFRSRKLDIPYGLPKLVPYLYFQAPGGEVFQLLPINENQSYYKGTGKGQNEAKQKEAEALKENALSELALRHQHQK